MATQYRDEKGNELTVMTVQEQAQCAEKDTPFVNGWMAEELGGDRISGESVQGIAEFNRKQAKEARERAEELGEGATEFAAECDAKADFCEAILNGQVEGRTVKAF